MGKIVAYLGPPTFVSQVVEGGANSLAHQQVTDSSSGYGLGWYPTSPNTIYPNDISSPVRIFSSYAVKADLQPLEVPRAYQSHCILATSWNCDTYNRNAASHQPLRSDSILLAMEAQIEGFQDVFLRPLTKELSDEAFGWMQGQSPSELCLALLHDSLESNDPDAMASALESVITRIQTIATTHDLPTSLAVVVTDGRALIAVRTATHGAPPPLYTTLADDYSPIPSSGRVVASEPTYPGAWQAIDAHALTIFVVEPTDESSL
ncbi:MAG: hypothetical protein KTR25_00660 [Myxococcales bacterium]|nr:hypothetical protein [Myxococcales bacterium]